MSARHQFTPQQLKNFAAYSRVQKSGDFNMLDPRARAQTGMSREEWTFTWANYDNLAAAAKELDAAAPAAKPAPLVSAEQVAAMDETAGISEKQRAVDPFYQREGFTPLLSGYKAARTTKD